MIVFYREFFFAFFFVLLSSSSFSVEEISSRLVIQNFPEAVRTISDAESFIRSRIPENEFNQLKVTRSENSLVFEVNDESYTVAFHQGQIIQHSSVTDKAMRAQDGPLQFGRTSERLGIPLLETSPQGRQLLETLRRNYRFELNEGELVNRYMNENGLRGANEIVENDNFRTIERTVLSATNHSEHPSTIMAHELQHLLNQYTLSDMVNELPREILGDPQQARAFTQMFDEYLAVKRSVEIYHSLISNFPHIATHEMQSLSRMNDHELKRFVVSKWSKFYRWNEVTGRAFVELPSSLNLTLRGVDESVASLRLRNDLPLPATFEKKIRLEQAGNDFSIIHESFASPLDSTLRVPFRPTEQNIFEIPYVELTPAQVDMVGRSSLPEFYRTPEGRVRYFIHPQSINYYRERIPNMELKWGEYAASSLASNRSLVVWEISHPENSRLVKVSLDATIGGVSRMNKPADLAHSVFASGLMREIPASFWQRHNMSALVEETAFTPRSIEFGMYDKSYINPPPAGTTELPSFALYTKTNGVTLLETLATNENLAVDVYYREKILKPLANYYTELYLKYGLMPEAHSQNMSILVRDGKLVGFTTLDMGGMNVDPEMRSINGLRTNPETYVAHFNEAYARTDYLESARTGAGKLIDVYFKRGFGDGFARLMAERNQLPLDSTRASLSADVDRYFSEAYKRQTGLTLGPGISWSDRLKDPFRQSPSASRTPTSVTHPATKCLLRNFILAR